jgi:hypothetical protein
MLAIKAPNIAASSRCPIVDDAAVAAVAAPLVAQLLGEDRGGGLVMVDYEGDVSLVRSLGSGVRIECGGITTEDIAVGVDPAEVAPVVEHHDNELLLS